jgi:hypothetical protein
MITKRVRIKLKFKNEMKNFFNKLLNQLQNNWFYILTVFVSIFVVFNIKWILIGIISILGGLFLYNKLKSFF